MKYQDFFSDENLVSSEDTIFIFHTVKISRSTSVSANRKRASQHRARLTFVHKSFALPNEINSVGRLVVEMEFSNEVPNFDLNFFDEEQNERTDRRFVPVTDSEVDKLIETEENANTKRKTLCDINFVKQFLTEHGESRSIEEIPEVELNNYLSKFIFAARTKKGEEYEPSSLRGILSSVERHLRRAGYGKSIIKENDFQKTRDALKVKQKELKRQGKGNKPKATTALSDEEIDILYGKTLLGLSSPQALVNTVWLDNMLHFGLRGCKEQRELRWGDVALKSDSEGKQYLEYFVERQSKTRTGENPRNQRQVKPRMYEHKAAVSAERDPVQVYKAYKDKRPENMLQPDSPFYLAPNYFKTEGQLKSEGSKWFKSQPMGVNKLNSLMKEMTETAGFSVKTNHSGRKTLVQKHSKIMMCHRIRSFK